MNNKLVDLSSKVVEALEDDVLCIAMEIGHDVLSTRTGVKTLLEGIEGAIPYGDKEDDARDLYHIGAKSHGKLNRQKRREHGIIHCSPSQMVAEAQVA